MKVKIIPSKVTNGNVTIPPSKSLAHRAIICAGLAPGRSIISNIDYSVDIKATIEGLRHLGADIKEKGNSLIINGIRNLHYDSEIVDCCESGSTLRFFIPIFSLCGEKVVFKGSRRLVERPQSVYETLFEEQDIFFQKEYPYITVSGRLQPGILHLKGNVSSQFITGLLCALPLLDGDSAIHVEPPFESKSYVNLTIQMLKKFGICITYEDNFTLKIKGRQHYCPADVEVEGDYSQLAFFASLGLINQPVTAHGLSLDSLQGDKAVVKITETMNGNVKLLENGYLFSPSTLKGTVIDMNDCPDLGPMLFALATQAEGTTTFLNAQRLRMKESDRIEAMETELKKLGCDISSTSDTVTITGPAKIQGNAELRGHNDHRIVMALSILSTIAEKPVIIDDAEAVNKSYPGFFHDLKNCGIQIKKFE